MEPARRISRARAMNVQAHSRVCRRFFLKHARNIFRVKKNPRLKYDESSSFPKVSSPFYIFLLRYMRSTRIDMLLEFTLNEQPIEIIGSIGENKSATRCDGFKCRVCLPTFIISRIFEIRSLSGCKLNDRRCRQMYAA